MQRYETKTDAKIGNYISYDNTGKFYHGLPYENMVGKIVSLDVENQPEDLLIEFDIQGKIIQLSIPFFFAQ